MDGMIDLMVSIQIVLQLIMYFFINNSKRELYDQLNMLLQEIFVSLYQGLLYYLCGKIVKHNQQYFLHFFIMSFLKLSQYEIQ
jgi:hypothetical protein